MNQSTKVLVIGEQGTGKSSLVKKFIAEAEKAEVDGEETITVEDADQEMETPLIEKEKEKFKEKHVPQKVTLRFKKSGGEGADIITFTPSECIYNGVPVTIIDSQGFADPSLVIEPEDLSNAKSCNVVLICHRLYKTSGVDDRKLLDSVMTLGKEFLECAIFVFTFGDKHEVYDDPLALEELTNDAIKARMEEREKEIKDKLKAALLEYGVSEEIVNNIPSIITSKKEVSLPTSTSDNWIAELWGLVEARCRYFDSPNFTKEGAKFLFIGHNQIGKSSLINKCIGKEVTTVGDGLQPTKHDGPVVRINCTIKGVVPVIIFDSRGFGDVANDDKDIVEAAISEMKIVDAVLICHKLYGSVDATTTKLLAELAKAMGNELMKHAIFVFTFGDEYITRCKPKPVSKLPKSEIKAQMEDHAKEVKEKLQDILIANRIKEEIVDEIPSIITSGEEDSLPTSDNWVDDFWALCEERCKPEAKGFVNWVRRHTTVTASGAAVGAAIGGVAVGAVGGALVGTGTIPIPGVGTAVGAVVGGVAGGITGSLLGSAGGAAVGKVGAMKSSNN